MKVGMVRFAIMLLQCRGQVRQRTEGRERAQEREGEERSYLEEREAYV
jgi:hypothetical protein